ncbi:hypothetical protein GCM10028801_30240 [Nocardioides maradonensis]
MRDRLDPYELGKIDTSPCLTNPALVTARARYRDRNNVLRSISASAPSKAKAERELKRKVKKLSETHQGGTPALNQDTTVAKAVGVWVDHCKRKRKNGKPLSPETIRQYEDWSERYVKGTEIEHLTVVQANDIARINSWLAGLADNRGEGAAKNARRVLSGTLNLAEEHGAIEMSKVTRVRTPGATAGSVGAERMCRDDDCDMDCGKRHSGVGRAFTVDEWLTVAKLLEEERYGVGAQDIADLVHFLFGTGARIGEALNRVRWEDLDINGRSVHVRGTKSVRADRTLEISDELAERLEERRKRLGGNPPGLAFGITRFPTKVGQPRDRTNVIRAVTAVTKRTGIDWAGTHTFRRTVATWMDERGVGLAEIANQLGHANVNVTAGYLGRTLQPTRAASIMVTPPSR